MYFYHYDLSGENVANLELIITQKNHLTQGNNSVSKK